MSDQLLKLVETLQSELMEIREQLKTQSTDLMELQEVTGISFKRWDAARREQNVLYLRNRIEYHRSQGCGLLEAGRLANADLREKRLKELS